MWATCCWALMLSMDQKVCNPKVETHISAAGDSFACGVDS